MSRHCVCSRPSACGERTVRQEKALGTRERNAQYLADHCANCHAGPLNEEEERANPQGFRGYQRYKQQGVHEFIRLNENRIWETDDLHSQAYANIDPTKSGNELAARMQRVLAAHRPAGYAIHKAAECLTCHAVDLTVGRAPAVSLADKKFEDFEPRYGVSCEACHGLAEQWIGPHAFQAEAWRKTSPEDKAKKGLNDLRDPYVKAMKCASCHIGNKEEGKFVTHEMYAAGHPPLPPFELVTYGRDQPSHFFPHRDNKTLRKLAEADAEGTWRLFHYRIPADEKNPKGECPDARAFAVGSVAAFETAMKLLAEDAKAVAANPGELLDFAHFDCFACHHDLKVPSDRQKPRLGIAPGRPTMRPLPTETLRAVFAHAEGAVAAAQKGELEKAWSAFGTHLKELNAAFSSLPFGNPQQVSDRADALAKAAGTARPLIDGVVYTPEETRKLHARLAEQLATLRGRKDNQAGDDGLYLDHDTAQQLAWGWSC